MSSKLKKKSKNKDVFTKYDKFVFKKEEERLKRDNMIDKLFIHMRFIGFYDLRDRFGFGAIRIKRFWDAVEQVTEKYAQNILKTEEINNYCMSKGINVPELLKTIPVENRFILAGLRKDNPLRFTELKYINAVIQLYIMVADSVLKEAFKFSVSQVKKFNEEIKYYIDSYTRLQPGTNEYYLDDNGCNEMLKAECGIDVLKEYYATL